MNEQLYWNLYHAAKHESWVDRGHYTTVLDPRRFMELIVGECVDVLNKRFMGDLNREDMEVRRCVESVKDHFGVK